MSRAVCCAAFRHPICAVMLALFAVAPSAAGTLFGLRNAGDSGRQVVTLDPTTAAVTPVSSSIDPPSGVVSGVVALDASGHRFFFMGTPDGEPTQRLYTVDTQTGAVLRKPPLIDGASSVVGLEYDPAGVLYAIRTPSGSQSKQLVTLNDVTGGATPVSGDLPERIGMPSGATALDPAGHRFFFIGFQDFETTARIYTVDTQTGALLGSPTVTGGDITGLEYDEGADILYGLISPAPNYNGRQLVTVDPITGTTIAVGPIHSPTGLGTASGVTALDPGGDRFYFAGAPSGEDDSRIYTLDTSTGAALSSPTIVGSAVQFFEGLAFKPGPSVVQGTVYYDFNRDGDRDGGEVGMGGWTIELRQGTEVIQTTATNAQGEYQMTVADPGDYTVCEVTQAYWILTGPQPGIYPVTITTAQDLNGLDFGNWQWVPCPQQPGCLPCLDPLGGLMNWYPLDETAGSTSLETVRGVNAAWTGNPTVVLGEKAVNSLSFPDDGLSENYISAASSPWSNFGTRSFSVASWIRATSGVGNRPIVDKVGFDAGVFDLVGYETLLVQGVFAVRLYDRNAAHSEILARNGSLADGLWHHVAAVVDRGSEPSVKLYVDGEDQTPDSPPTPAMGSISSSQPVCIARGCYLGGWFAGGMDEVQLFGRALSATVVKCLYQHPLRYRNACKVPAAVSVYSGTGTPPAGSNRIALTIFNHSITPQSYRWTLSESSGGAWNPGDPSTILFGQQTGTVVVPAGYPSNRVTVYVPVAVECPTLWAARSYFATVVNLGSLEGCKALGKLQNAGILNQCPVNQLRARLAEAITVENDSGPIPILMGTSRAIDFTVSNRSAAPQSVTYHFACDYEDPSPDARIVSLNGLPPGTATPDQMVTIPGGGAVVLAVHAQFVDASGTDFPDVVLKADVDGDQTPEAFASWPIQSIDYPILPASVDGPAVALAPGDVRTAPNPFRNAMTIEFALPAAGHVDIEAFDVAGRRVRTVMSGRLGAGVHAVQWQGDDDRGVAVGSGIYLIRVRSPGDTRTIKTLAVH